MDLWCLCGYPGCRCGVEEEAVLGVGGRGEVGQGLVVAVCLALSAQGVVQGGSLILAVLHRARAAARDESWERGTMAMADHI